MNGMCNNCGSVLMNHKALGTKRKNDVIGILQEIRFNFLMILNLSHNFIETVEGINRVDAPILQTLSLRNKADIKATIISLT